MRPGERNRERGRVRDLSGQYHRRTLTTKILASLNWRCTVTELRLPELQAHRKKPLSHTSATQIVKTGSGLFSFHFLDLVAGLIMHLKCSIKCLKDARSIISALAYKTVGSYSRRATRLNRKESDANMDEVVALAKKLQIAAKYEHRRENFFNELEIVFADVRLRTSVR
ncbi:uncharacterized protein LOC142633321 isoform X3 [Castanea sativa]|uniref:uncharacterized protein LOC142633321 isoform X3 n=1 Tax=Castanea sativa TaxID=21020 RepID=UPI003F64A747